jgi:hypothetical protein
MSYLAQTLHSVAVILLSAECVYRGAAAADSRLALIYFLAAGSASRHIQKIGLKFSCNHACRPRICGQHDSTLTSEITRKVKIMPLIQLLEILIVVGVLLWLVNRFIPMQSSIKSILNGVVVIAVVLWLLNVFGLFHNVAHIRVGRG